MAKSRSFCINSAYDKFLMSFPRVSTQPHAFPIVSFPVLPRAGAFRTSPTSPLVYSLVYPAALGGKPKPRPKRRSLLLGTLRFGR